MPECSVKCPKVRRYLREIVAETPWILDEQKPASDDEEIASYTVATTWSRPKGKHIEDSPYPSTSTEDAEAGASTKFSEKSDKVKKTIHEDITTGFEETMETRKKQDIDHEQLEKSKLIATTDESGSSTGDQRDRRKDKQHIVPRDIDAGKSDVMSVKLNGRSRKEREIISDKMKARSSHSSSSLEISTRLADGETSTHKKEAGHDQMLQTADDARKSTEFTQTGSRMTCSSICSRNISKGEHLMIQIYSSKKLRNMDSGNEMRITIYQAMVSIISMTSVPAACPALFNN
ncbi:hypothetical protein KM043_011482 [Ampulex compressa]|nr:hypothetical protein KM043_011482 [Ampulex compressa]